MLLKNPPGGMVTAFIIRLELGFCLIELFLDQFDTDILCIFQNEYNRFCIYGFKLIHARSKFKNFADIFHATL